MKEGRFTAVIWIHSHAETGEECGYSLTTITGDGVPLDVLKPLVKHAESDRNLADAFDGFMVEDGTYIERLDWWYQFTFHWMFEPADSWEDSNMAALDIESAEPLDEISPHWVMVDGVGDETDTDEDFPNGF